MIKDLVDKQVFELKKLWANKRQLTFQVLNLAMIVFSALMIWKGLMFLTKVCIKLCVSKELCVISCMLIFTYFTLLLALDVWCLF